MLKRMILLASALAALVAFVAPAAASAAAPEWYTDPGDVTLAEGEEEAIHIVGELTSTAGFESGPCAVTFTGVAENENGMAGGAITAGNIKNTESCNTSLPGCTFIGHVNLNGTNSWPITGVEITGEPGIEIREATFTNTYSEFCQTTYGVPAEVSATGTATGIVTTELNQNGESCVTFDNHPDDMVVEVGGVHTTTAVDIDGEVCVTAPVTLH